MSQPETTRPASSAHGRPWGRWALAIATAAGLALYLWGDGGCDDANISFRYAAHIAHGYGSVWNLSDPPSMGSSTPVWLLFLALVERLWPGHIALAANVVAAVSWGALTAVAWAIGAQLGWRRPWMAALVLAGLAPVAAARMRGMETPVYALLIATAYLAWLRRPEGWKWGVWAGLCAAIRLDGLLVPVVLGASSLIKNRRVPFAAAAVALVTYLPWLGWQWSATSALVPQTMHAKALWQGCGRFIPLWLPVLTARPVVGIALWAALVVAAVWGLKERRLWPMAVWAVAYCAAYVAAKLPHMGWYYMPLLVPVALLAGAAADRVRYASGAIAGLAIVSGVTMVAAGHPWSYNRITYPPVMPAAAFRQHGVTRIGTWLRDHDPGAMVLTNEVGIIGNISGCRVIDALGLVTRETWPYIRNSDFTGMARDLKPDYIAWRTHNEGEPLPWAPGYRWLKGWRDDAGWYGLYLRGDEPARSDSAVSRPSRAAYGTRAKHVLLIVSDALRADHVGCYGCKEHLTPNIDKLAARAARFANAYAAASWTCPSNAGLFTGRYPREVRARGTLRLSGSATTMAECFRQAGFATAGFSAHVLISGEHGFAQGFQSFVCKTTQDDEMTARCIEWIGAHKDQPFFVLLYLLDPHWPYDPEKPGEYLRPRKAHIRKGIETGYLPLDPDLRVPRIVANPHGDREISMEEVRYLHALYKGDIVSVDDRIGRVLAAVRDIPDLAVVMTSDHGEEWLDHGGLSHLYTLYDELLRIPLLISAPGQAARVVKAPVTNLDVMPTLLDLAGIPAPPGMRGMDVLGPANIPQRPLSAEIHGWNTRGVSRYSVRIGSQTLVWTTSGLPFEPKPPPEGFYERYDFVKDPGEKHPLALYAPGGDALWREMRVFGPLAAEARTGAQRVKLDRKTQEELRALGYIGH
jgi:arylsulfatase A-like enzyme